MAFRYEKCMVEVTAIFSSVLGIFSNSVGPTYIYSGVYCDEQNAIVASSLYKNRNQNTQKEFFFGILATFFDTYFQFRLLKWSLYKRVAILVNKGFHC